MQINIFASRKKLAHGKPVNNSVNAMKIPLVSNGKQKRNAAFSSNSR